MDTWDMERVIAALRDLDKPFPPLGLYRLSDLSPEDARVLAEAWPTIPLARRRSLLEDMLAFLDYSDRFSFREVGLIALDDEDPYVRKMAIDALWEEGDERIARRLVQLLRNDPDPEVREQAAAALGEYVYLGEIEEISPETYREVAQALREVLLSDQEPLAIRRRALEAYSFATDPDVPRWIEDFYRRGVEQEDEASLVSALFAMGRSADPRWTRYVVLHLHDRRPKVRAEAATAAGRLEMKRAIPDLLELLEDANADVRMAAAWALSELGGGEERVEEALQRALQRAEEVGDEEEVQVLAEALDNLAFQNSIVMAQLDLLDMALEMPEDVEDWDLDIPDEFYDKKKRSNGFNGNSSRPKQA
ncbi:MAG: HEAT repeat domain-containing protein [Chloroflexi bacterium]|nr:HEAT repeat domain-containing protein [Chloroflexota bacterium]